MAKLVCENITDENNVPQPFANSILSLEIAKGNVPGIVQTEKFGRSTNVDTVTPPTDIWDGGGIYTGFPNEVETLEISSSSVNDTLLGTGARTVIISNLLDGDGNEMPDVIVNLNGTSWVSLGTQTYSRCTRIRVISVGSNGGNEGLITLRHTTTTANIFAVVPIGKNSTSIMAYTVPTGKTLFVNRGFISLSRASGGSGSANVTIRVRSNGVNTPFIAVRDIEITNSLSYLFANGGYFVFPERTDFKVSIDSVSDNNTIIASEYDGYLVDN